MRITRSHLDGIRAVQHETATRDRRRTAVLQYNGRLNFAGQAPAGRIFGPNSPLLARFSELAVPETVKEQLQRQLGGFITALRADETKPVPAGCRAQRPSPRTSPLVGLRGDAVPGWQNGKIASSILPDAITRLPAATKSERRHESAFADAFCANPKAMVKLYESFIRNNIYGTDAAKRCYAPWGAASKPANKSERVIRATMNAAVHGTATALTHLAVYRRMSKLADAHALAVAAHDKAKAKGKPVGPPPEPPHIAMTVGPCGAGKGAALSRETKLRQNYNHRPYDLIFDAAGEAESTEIMPMLRACKKYGFKLDLICVERSVEAAAERALERVDTSGRLVDLIAFGRSHTTGIDNFRMIAETAEFKQAVADGILKVRIFTRTKDGGIVETNKTTMDEPKHTISEVLEIALLTLAKFAKADPAPNGAILGWDGAKIAATIDQAQLPRLSGAAKSVRKHELAFMGMFCAAPKPVVQRYEGLVRGGVYTPERAKRCYDPWGASREAKTGAQQNVRNHAGEGLAATASAITTLAVYRRLNKLNLTYTEALAAFAKKKDAKATPPRPPHISVTVGDATNSVIREELLVQAAQRESYDLTFDAVACGGQRAVDRLITECRKYGFPLDIIAIEGTAVRVVETVGPADDSAKGSTEDGFDSISNYVVKGCLAGLARTWRSYDQWFDTPATDAKTSTRSAA